MDRVVEGCVAIAFLDIQSIQGGYFMTLCFSGYAQLVGIDIVLLEVRIILILFVQGSKPFTV